MSRIEDVLRAATHGTAREVEPGSIPHLDLSTVSGRRKLTWVGRVPLGPVLVGAAIALIAIATVGLRAYQRTAPSSSQDLPPYYLSLIPTGSSAWEYTGATLEVVSTLSGAILTSVPPPKGYAAFTIVAGTEDARTFLVGAVPPSPRNAVVPTRLFTLTYQPDGNTVSLTRLPVAPIDNLATASLSPDRTYLVTEARNILRIYNLRTGAQHSWKAGGDGAYITWSRDPHNLTFTADNKTLSVVWGNGNLGEEQRLLDTANQGNDLSHDSRGLIRLGFSGWDCTSDPFISANGSVVLCGGYTDTTGTSIFLSSTTTIVTTGFAEFSATTGKMVAILDPLRQRLPSIRSPLNSRPSVDTTKLPRLFWASPNASTLIGTRNGKAFAFRDGQEQRIPLTPGLSVPILWVPLTGVAW